VNTPSASIWLQRTPAPDAAGRVFCIPQAGCGTSVFGRWPERLRGIEFLPVELPGRLSRFGQPMPPTFQALAEVMLTGLRPYLDVPFAFFGHCWSAIAAYEATALAERGGRAVTRLFVSSDLPPHEPRTNAMSTMTEGELGVEVAKMIRVLGKEPHPDLMAIYVKILRDDMAVRSRYVAPEPLRLATPITAFGWTDDEEIRPDQMNNWADCGEVKLEILPGDHNGFSAAPPEMLDTICFGMKA